MTLCTESVVNQTDHFSRKRCCDVRKLTADAILFKEIQCKKTDILMFYQRFQCKYGWNKVAYARIAIRHVCFIALTLALTPFGLVLKQLPRDPANMSDPYIHS